MSIDAQAGTRPTTEASVGGMLVPGCQGQWLYPLCSDVGSDVARSWHVGARAGRQPTPRTPDPEIECEIRIFKRGIFALRPHGGPGDTLKISVLITRSRLIELVEKGARSAQERVEVAPVVA